MWNAVRCAVVIGCFVGAVPRIARADLSPIAQRLEHGDYAEVVRLASTTRGSERGAAEVMAGDALLATGRLDEAAQLGERLARSAATRVAGFTLQGDVLAARSRYADAIAAWREAFDGRSGNEARRARVHAIEWLVRLGRRDEAREAANPLLDEYNDAMQWAESHPVTAGAPDAHAAALHDVNALTALGVAMRALGSMQDANQAFNDALRAGPHRVETLVEHARLYASKDDYQHAGESLREALAINPHDPRALVLHARARLASDLDFARAIDDLDAADAVSPSLPDALAVRAQIVLRDGDVASADRLLDRALAIAPEHLESLATRGVVRFRANDLAGFRVAFDRVFAIAPGESTAYALVADFADWEHRYDEAATLMREGLARPGIANDPRLQAPLRAQLGMNLLRTGDETGALEQLDESFARDRYNVRVFNVLNLYEHTIAPDYTFVDGANFRVRYANRERAVMVEYVPRLLEQAWADMVARYGFTPTHPIAVEMFADPEHFSVRTAGVPEVGVQGVCFGRVITAISPTGGPFNWQQILWHELAHVFAIQRSHSRVPRWFTEGLAEWEAFHSHPEWSREDDVRLYRAAVADRIPHVASFNTAFTHARSGNAMTLAYYAASKLVEFLIDQYGFARVAALLPSWGDGLETTDVVTRGLGVAPDEIDRRFRTYSLQRLARYDGQFYVDDEAFEDRAHLDQLAIAAPGDASAQARAAYADLLAHDLEAMRARAAAALAIDPHEPVAHWALAVQAFANHDFTAVAQHVDDLAATHHDGFDVRMLEARAARSAHDDARMQRALEAATVRDPEQVDAWSGLAALAHTAHRDDAELAALRHVVALDQHDREAFRGLLHGLATTRAWTEIVALRERSHGVDPETVETHVTMARALAETGARPAALDEYRVALLLEPPDAGAIRAAMARVQLAAGDRAGAIVSAREAMRLQPADPSVIAVAHQLGLH